MSDWLLSVVKAVYNDLVYTISFEVADSVVHLCGCLLLLAVKLATLSFFHGLSFTRSDTSSNFHLHHLVKT